MNEHITRMSKAENESSSAHTLIHKAQYYTTFYHLKNNYNIRFRIQRRSSWRWSWHSRHWPWDGTSWCTGCSTPLASMGALAAPRQSRCSGSWSESAQHKTASHFKIASIQRPFNIIYRARSTNLCNNRGHVNLKSN